MSVNLLAFSDISVKLRRVFYGRKPDGASVCLKKSTFADALAAASGCQRRNDRSSYPPVENSWRSLHTGPPCCWSWP